MEEPKEKAKKWIDFFAKDNERLKNFSDKDLWVITSLTFVLNVKGRFTRLDENSRYFASKEAAEAFCDKYKEKLKIKTDVWHVPEFVTHVQEANNNAIQNLKEHLKI